MSRKEYTVLIVEFLQIPKNLPHFIPRSWGPMYCHRCLTNHKGFLIKKFNPQTKIFTCIHGNENGQVAMVDNLKPYQLREFLLECFEKKEIRLKPLRQKMDLSDYKRSYIIQFRVRKKEKLFLEKKAFIKGITVGEYVRKKAMVY